MTTGTGWCFGGPRVTAEDANASVIARQIEVPGGTNLAETFEPKTIQALMAFGPDGEKVDLLPRLAAEGKVDWTAEGGAWRVFAISQKPSPQKVKRAAPGGEGWMLNLFYPRAMTNYLRWFDEAFAAYRGPMPRAQYQDSYEYQSDWSPDFFAQFEQRRGYRLQDELPALFGSEANDRAARVKCDYRETISDLMAEVTLPLWAQWSRDHGFLTRDEAHGSPGNLLDLYAVADIPETEMFHLDREKLISKFASSAAHVAGHPLTSSETGTWLEEHFTGTLADMKFLLDDLFLSGINHIFYHGTCYSPDEAGWPGWVFYASFEMNPRNSIWRDVPALNAYAARCQAVLQSGRPDNDMLVYWPIHDCWSNPSGLVQTFTVSNRKWFNEQPIGKTAAWLWNRGYQFDYVSDRQLASARATNGLIAVPGGNYRVVIVPRCEHMPAQTLGRLLALAQTGASVIFEEALPKDVPGLGNLEARRAEFVKLRDRANELSERVLPARNSRDVSKPVSGRLLVGSLETALAFCRVQREEMFDQLGLMCIRRAMADGRVYFIANRGGKLVDQWLPIATDATAAVILDPLTGRTGVARLRSAKPGGTEVHLQLASGQALILRTLPGRDAKGSKWSYWEEAGGPVALRGNWQVSFLQGGPELPASFETGDLASWTELGDANARRFAGTALYTLKFDAPEPASRQWRLDLGNVCQSARVRLNGKDLGTLFTPPFRAVTGRLKSKGNVLEVEVTNVSANRIRDLDQRGVKWKNFRDINFVDLNYHPFDASRWPLTASGLLGPVTLTPLSPAPDRN
jgi:hypothetical protein